MHRRNFIKTTTAGSAFALAMPPLFFNNPEDKNEDLWFDRSMRWAQLTLVENDPGRFDPDFWLDYFKKIHADACCLSAGGIVAYYPTQVPLHHRSAWMGSSDPFGYLVDGCRKMNMAVIARTDPHAARDDVYEQFPDRIAVDKEGNKRRHWSNPELWVTCCLGSHNLEFMTDIHKEIMERYDIDGIFSNRWAGSGTCFCDNCRRDFKAYSGMEIPSSSNPRDPEYNEYVKWRNLRLKEIWVLWDNVIRKQNALARFIPNGYPDKTVTRQLSDIVFTDHQARNGYTFPWSNGKGAKELRSAIGMKPLGGIFSVGIEEQYRWKDSVQTEAEIRIWVAEGTANGMRPWFTKFGGYIYDKRWLGVVEKIYTNYHRIEKYLRNTAPMARVGVIFSNYDSQYGSENWQQNSTQHESGMYHALLENRIPFEMVNDQYLDQDQLKHFKLLILPNVATLSERQCNQLTAFVENGGSLLATYETSLYDENGSRRQNFGLAELFGASYAGKVEGPMRNSYLRLKSNPATGKFHPVLSGLEDAYRIINTIYQVKVNPVNSDAPQPVTLIPSYPDLPMEDVYPREPETNIRALYLNDFGTGRVAYFPGDIDRSFWQLMTADHSGLLKNTVKWALNEEPIVEVEGPGLLDVTVWKQEESMTVHLVNLTNPMMMKGPFREFIPVSAKVTVKIPGDVAIKGVHLLLSDGIATYQIKDGKISIPVPQVHDHEIVAIDFL